MEMVQGETAQSANARDWPERISGRVYDYAGRDVESR